MLLVAALAILKQELVSLVTTKTTAQPVSPEWGLVLEDYQVTPSRVGTWQIMEIMETSIYGQWDISWFNNRELKFFCAPGRSSI